MKNVLKFTVIVLLTIAINSNNLFAQLCSNPAAPPWCTMGNNTAGGEILGSFPPCAFGPLVPLVIQSCPGGPTDIDLWTNNLMGFQVTGANQDANVVQPTSGYQIGGNYVLWHNNN